MTDLNTDKTKSGFGSDVTGADDKAASLDNQENQSSTITPEEMARILKRDAHAQAHIERLEAEAREREEMLAALQGQMEEFNKGAEDQARLDALEAARIAATTSKETTGAVDVDAIIEQVQARTEQQKAAAVAQRNYEDAVAWAKETYGETFSSTVEEKAKALGMTVEDSINLASKSPSAFKTLFGTVNSAAPRTADRSGVNSLALQQNLQDQVSATEFITNYREKGFRALGTKEAFDAFRKN